MDFPTHSPSLVANRLAELTGDLTVPADRSEELERARRLVARSILRGPSLTAAGQPAQPSTPVGPETRLIAAEEILFPRRTLMIVWNGWCGGKRLCRRPGQQKR